MNQLWQLIRPYLSITVRYFRISYVEAKSEYEGTRLGILWIPASTIIFTGLLGLVFHNAGTMSEVDFFLYVLSGYVTWSFIQDSINNSTNVIQGKLDFAVHNRLSLAGLFGKMLVDRLFEYGINLGLLILAMLVLSPHNFGPAFLLYPLLLALMCLSSLALSYLVNLLTLFYPDLSNVIRTFTRLMFFATPIFWVAESNKGGVKGALERYNPAAYFIKAARQVFGVEPFAWNVWMVVLTATAVTVAAGLVAYYRSANFVRNIK